MREIEVNGQKDIAELSLLKELGMSNSKLQVRAIQYPMHHTFQRVLCWRTFDLNRLGKDGGRWKPILLSYFEIRSGSLCDPVLPGDTKQESLLFISRLFSFEGYPESKFSLPIFMKKSS